jgi:excisionase family DNA binding protein
LNEEELISLSEAAVISGLGLKHLGLLARQGKLRAWKIGRNWVTTRPAVEEYLRDSFKRSRDPYKNKRR